MKSVNSIKIHFISAVLHIFSGSFVAYLIVLLPEDQISSVAH